MVMDYWSEKRLNHHSEATTMLYGAPECARIAPGEGLEARFARRAAAGRAVVTGARAMGLTVFGDDAYRMTNLTGIIPEGVDGEVARRRMREDFEIAIGAAFEAALLADDHAFAEEEFTSIWPPPATREAAE